MLASVTTLWAVRLWTCVRNKQWLRLSLLRRQSDHTEGEVPSCRLLSVTGWCSHGSFSLVLFVAWSVVLFGSPLGASDWMAAGNVCSEQTVAATVTSPATIWSYRRRGSCRLLSVTGWCSHWSFSMVHSVAWSVVLFGSPLGASDWMAAGNVCPVMIALRAESTSICPLTAFANAYNYYHWEHVSHGNDDVCERRLRVGLQFGWTFVISLIALELVYIYRQWEWVMSPSLARTLSPSNRLASLIPSLPFWRRTTVGSRCW